MTALISGLTTWSSTLLHLVTVADPVPEDSEVQPGPWMAIVILLLVAVSVFLWFSMRKQLGRIRVPRRHEVEGTEATRGPGPSESRSEASDADVGNDRPTEPPVS